MRANLTLGLAFLLPALCEQVLASSLHDHQVEELAAVIELQSRQAGSGTFPITGIQNAGVQPRLEIRQMQQNSDMWNLFMLGLARFMQTDRSDKFSYYQIAGG